MANGMFFCFSVVVVFLGGGGVQFFYILFDISIQRPELTNVFVMFTISPKRDMRCARFNSQDCLEKKEKKLKVSPFFPLFKQES